MQSSKDAISKSAVYNYIGTNGSLGNIEYDISRRPLTTELCPQSVKGFTLNVKSNLNLLSPTASDLNQLLLVDLATATNSPISTGTALYTIYHTPRTQYNKNIAFLIHLDTGMMYVNNYHPINSSWSGWQEVSNYNINNNKAISQSAVYNYIRSDGTIGNIEFDISFFDRYYEGISNRIGCGIFSNFISGYGCYTFIPLDRADLRTNTLRSVVVSGDNTEYISNCRITTGLSQGIVVECKTDLSGKLATVSFDSTKLS